ncbi:hypothetical protein PFISCL1PPCAC_21823, partial [Pristionchus fissidentatus]
MQWHNASVASRTEFVPSVQRLSQTLRTSQIRVPVDHEQVPGQRRSSNGLSRIRLHVLDRVNDSYRILCETRLMGELSARELPPHPLEMNDSDFTPIPLTPNGFHHCNRLFLSALLQFGSRAFPEFALLSKEEKWSIVTHFFCRFRLFEYGYRADQRFPNDPGREFSGYTMYVDAEIVQNFYPDDVANRSVSI